MTEFNFEAEFFQDMMKYHLRNAYSEDDESYGHDFYSACYNRYHGAPTDAAVLLSERREFKLAFMSRAYGNTYRPDIPELTIDPFRFGTMSHITIKRIEITTTACPTTWELIDTQDNVYSARFRHDVLKVYRSKFYSESDLIYNEKISDDNSGFMHVPEMLALTGFKVTKDCEVKF